MAKYNTHTLPNGLRIIHLPSASRVVYCGYQIAAGTRDEAIGEEGIAHFCEHMTFTGTEKRNALQIINALEGLGGELNAFTNKEDTTFYAAISKEHFAQAINVLTDIVFHSQYPQQEIDKEVEVICDEIESYNDSPAELIYDEFENILFEGHPLGHNILGKAEQLRTYTTEDALRFVHRYYRPDNAIFFAYGDIDFKRLVKSLEFRIESLEFATASWFSLGFRVDSLEFATAAWGCDVLRCAAVANSKLSTLHSPLEKNSTGLPNSKLWSMSSSLSLVLTLNTSTHNWLSEL